MEAVKIEILPSYVGQPVVFQEYFTDTLEFYGLDQDYNQGTYAFFYYQENPSDNVSIIKLATVFETISEIGKDFSGFYSS